MQARVLESPGTRETLVQVTVDNGDVLGFSPDALIAEIRTCLAEKIAQSLFEKVDPAIMEALKGHEG